MARNGSGTYNRAVASYVAGTTITAATVNSEMDDIATALTGSMARNGESPATANIPMGGFRLTGLGNAIANTDAAALGQVTTYALAKAGDTASGALGVIAGTAAAPGVFVSGDTNTGLFQPAADTLAVTVGGAEVARFGANGLQSASPWVDLASAATTDLGAQTTDNLRITGTTTITSFGTAANGVTRNLRFAAALTLTHNATSLILPGGANITTAAGDTGTVKSLGSGNWVVVSYQPAGGYVLPGSAVVVPLGTAAAPSVSFSGDPDTGALSPGANRIQFATNGIARQEIAADGSQLSVIPGGSALLPDFKCRAWVNFNGTGTVAIRASGNVSSITDNATGDYTVNFITAMPDANYMVAGTAQRNASNDGGCALALKQGVTALTTSSVRIATFFAGPGNEDCPQVHVAIFR
jgi:hypothetical protein